MELQGLNIGQLSARHPLPFNPFRRDLERVIAQNTTGSVTLTAISTGEAYGATNFRYSGAVYAPDDGLIYLVPRDVVYVRWFNPSDDSTGTFTPPGLTGTSKFLGGFYFEGFVYFSNWQFGAFVKMDVRPTLKNGESNPDYRSVTSFGSGLANDGRYRAGFLVDSRQYFAKQQAAAVGFEYLDLISEELINIGEPAFAVGGRYWSPIAAGTSLYYMNILTDVGGSHIAKYDLKTSTWTQLTLPASAADAAWVTGHAMPDGRVVYTPSKGTTCLILDLEAETFSESNAIGTIDSANGEHSALGGDGRLYCSAFDNSDGLRVFDPTTDTFSLPIANLSPPITAGIRLYSGMVTFEDNLFCLPSNTDHVLKINLSGVSAFFNEGFVVSSHNSAASQ